eukprot:2768890-Rhodomonas_salina.2
MLKVDTGFDDQGRHCVARDREKVNDGEGCKLSDCNRSAGCMARRQTNALAHFSPSCQWQASTSCQSVQGCNLTVGSCGKEWEQSFMLIS